MISDAAKQFLSSVHNDPRWREVISEIQDYKLPSFKPRKGASERASSEDQMHHWIYSSGCKDERSRLLSLLGENDEQGND